jgi:hypothetical protein
VKHAPPFAVLGDRDGADGYTTDDDGC